MTRSVTVRGGVTLEYVEQGRRSGIPVVFLHGVTDSWRSFEGVLSHLSVSTHALAVSQRGHGDSSRPDTGYRMADFSSDLEAFLDALDLPPALIVGHSMGSYVAQHFALQCPDRTRGLVLMGLAPTLHGHAGVRELWESVVSTLADPVDRAFVRDFQRSTLARPVAPAFFETVVRESLKVPARVWRETFADFVHSDLSGALPWIAAPTLIVSGDRDEFSSRRDQMALHAAIPDSRVIVYPGGGHGFHWEAPARFAADVVAFAHQLSRSRLSPRRAETRAPQPWLQSA